MEGNICLPLIHLFQEQRMETSLKEKREDDMWMEIMELFLLVFFDCQMLLEVALDK
jgi:hypothetical protein